jgi:Holliday junction resolvase-like predicted endonuclease
VKSNFINLPTSSVGAIGELRVSTDLLGKGFEVFRSISPAASCDLIAMKQGKMLRVEVKTGYENPETGLAHSVRALNTEKHDVLAICYPSHIHYEPIIQY